MNGLIRTVRDDLRSCTAIRCWGLCLYAATYLSTAYLSRDLTFPSLYSPLWLPAGVALATFALNTPSRWPTLIATTAFANVLFNVVVDPKPIGILVGFLLANLVSALVGASLIQWIFQGRLRLSQPQDVLVFVLGGCLAATVASSLIGTITLYWTTDASMLATLPNWFGGNTVGILVAAPPMVSVMAFFRQWMRRAEKQPVNQSKAFCFRVSPFENQATAFQFCAWLLLLLLTYLAIWFVFRISSWPIWFIGLPTLLVLALRYEVTGVSWGMLIVTVIVVKATADGLGHFVTDENPSIDLLLSQMFLFTSSISFLTLASSLQQRRRLSEKLTRMQSSLTHLHRQTQLILDAIPSAVIYHDLDNRLVRVNRSAAKWLGRPRETLEGKRVENLEAQGVLGFALEHFQVHGDNVPSVGNERSVTLHNGEFLWVITDCVPLKRLNGQSMGRLVVMTDITTRKAVERQLAANNVELESFASVASHDLKEPLRAIGGYCRMLWEDYAERLDAEGQRFLQSAIDGTSRMDRLISDLLQFSRASQEPMPLRWIDLNEVVVSAQANLQALLVENEATVTVEALPHVAGCFVPLVQAFQNILSNAVKFAKPDEPPKVSITTTTVHPPDGLHEHLISITDEGIGIAPENHERIFKVFERLHNAQKYDGSGLGLAICRRVMDRHCGRIELESTPGVGTTFRLFFPVVTPSVLEFAA